MYIPSHQHNEVDMMAIQIRSRLGWRNREAANLNSIGTARSAVKPRSEGPISILSAYNSTEEARNSGEAACIARTVETLLLRRVQMLQ